MEDQRTRNPWCDSLWNAGPRIKGDKSQWSSPTFPQGRHLLCRISVKLPHSCVLELISSSLSISQEQTHHLGMQQVLLECLLDCCILHSQALRLLLTRKKPKTSGVSEHVHACSQDLTVCISSQPVSRNLTASTMVGMFAPWKSAMLESKAHFFPLSDCPLSNIYQRTAVHSHLG